MQHDLKCPRCGNEAILTQLKTLCPRFAISCVSPFCDNRATIKVKYSAVYPGVMTLSSEQKEQAKRELIEKWESLKAQPEYNGAPHKTYYFTTSYVIPYKLRAD